MSDELALRDLARCMDGAIPSVLCTASASGIPNITYLSKVLRVDDERVALSNQFFSKSARNLAENPHASLLVVDSGNHDEYRLTLAYERTERQGPVFEQLAADVRAIAALMGVNDVFRVRAADIYRCTAIERTPTSRPGPPARLADAGAGDAGSGFEATTDPRGLGELCARISRCHDLDTLVRVAVDGMAELLGLSHSMILLADEDGKRLFTIASHGYDAQGIGAEVAVGEGLAGMAAAQCAPIRVGNVQQMAKYGSMLRQTYEEIGIGPGHEVEMPGLPMAQSRLAVPAMALGQLVGVVSAESEQPGGFSDAVASDLQVVASLLASAVEAVRAEVRVAEARAARPLATASTPVGPTTHVRFFGEDGSTFLDGDYLIKGVAGRILWSLLRQHEDEGRVEFTNREVRLDKSLDLPDFRDNFESRLILLKRRLDERDAPICIAKTGRGRFQLEVHTALRLEAMGSPEA